MNNRDEENAANAAQVVDVNNNVPPAPVQPPAQPPVQPQMYTQPQMQPAPVILMVDPGYPQPPLYDPNQQVYGVQPTDGTQPMMGQPIIQEGIQPTQPGMYVPSGPGVSTK